MRTSSVVFRVALGSIVALALVPGPVDAKNHNADKGKPSTNPGNSGNVASTTLSCVQRGNAPTTGGASFVVEFKQGVTQTAIDTALGAIGGNGKRLENAGVGTIKFG
jgi:hypothetical protein